MDLLYHFPQRVWSMSKLTLRSRHRPYRIRSWAVSPLRCIDRPPLKIRFQAVLLRNNSELGGVWARGGLLRLKSVSTPVHHWLTCRHADPTKQSGGGRGGGGGAGWRAGGAEGGRGGGRAGRASWKARNAHFCRTVIIFSSFFDRLLIVLFIFFYRFVYHFFIVRFIVSGEGLDSRDHFFYDSRARLDSGLRSEIMEAL